MKNTKLIVSIGIAVIALSALADVVATLNINVSTEQRTALRWYARQINKSVADQYIASGNTNTPPEITWQQGADLLFQARMDKIVKEHKAWLDAKVAAQYSTAGTNTQEQIKTILGVQDN